MSDITLRVLGCGDAFSSGGRLQTCFHVDTGQQTLLLDCGATALLAMQQQGIDPLSVNAIILSHLHGDHFGGIPFLLMQAHFVAKRGTPLTVVGPKGTRERIDAALAILFPDIKDTVWRFSLDVIELDEGEPIDLDDVHLSPRRVNHPSGAPALAFRMDIDGRVLAFSGDTSWTDALIDIADGADLLIAECHGYRPNGVHHLDWQTLNAQTDHLRARRILLTHMSDAMLDRLPGLDKGRFEFAEDGLTTTI